MTNQTEDRHAHLERVREKMKKTVDGIGYEIEPGILPLVTVLNVLRLPTSGSCEGHVSRGRGTPWVDFEIEPDVSYSADDPYQYLTMEHLYREQVGFLTQLLSAFYTEHGNMPYGGTYYIHDLSSAWYSLASAVTCAFPSYDERERGRLLIEAQTGAARLAEWLGAHYLDGLTTFTPSEFDAKAATKERLEAIAQKKDPEEQLFRLVELCNRGAQLSMVYPLSKDGYREQFNRIRTTAREARREAVESSLSSAYLDLEKEIDSLLKSIEKKLIG